MVLFSVSGCASQDHRDQLAAVQRECAAGWQNSCVNAQAQANHDGAKDNAGNVAAWRAGMIALPADYIELHRQAALADLPRFIGRRASPPAWCPTAGWTA